MVVSVVLAKTREFVFAGAVVVFAKSRPFVFARDRGWFLEVPKRGIVLLGK